MKIKSGRAARGMESNVHSEVIETILNSIREGILAVDAEGRVTVFNQSAERLIGVPASQSLGMPVEKVIPNTRLHLVLKSGAPGPDPEPGKDHHHHQPDTAPGPAGKGGGGGGGFPGHQRNTAADRGNLQPAGDQVAAVRHHQRLTGVPFSWTRLGTSTPWPSPGCCGCCRIGRSFRWDPPSPPPWTSGSLRPPTPTWS